MTDSAVDVRRAVAASERRVGRAEFAPAADSLRSGGLSALDYRAAIVLVSRSRHYAAPDAVVTSRRPLTSLSTCCCFRQRPTAHDRLLPSLRLHLPADTQRVHLPQLRSSLLPLPSLLPVHIVSFAVVSPTAPVVAVLLLPRTGSRRQMADLPIAQHRSAAHRFSPSAESSPRDVDKAAW
jgi:hypothetical protein